jgi:HTH-type transcriptional regulator/antitoxin HigA
MRGPTRRGDRLEVLVTLVEAWEAKHHAIEAPDSVGGERGHAEA